MNTDAKQNIDMTITNPDQNITLTNPDQNTSLTNPDQNTDTTITDPDQNIDTTITNPDQNTDTTITDPDQNIDTAAKPKQKSRTKVFMSNVVEMSNRNHSIPDYMITKVETVNDKLIQPLADEFFEEKIKNYQKFTRIIILLTSIPILLITLTNSFINNFLFKLTTSLMLLVYIIFLYVSVKIDGKIIIPAFKIVELLVNKLDDLSFFEFKSLMLAFDTNKIPNLKKNN